jgi:hypothetical protein
MKKALLLTGLLLVLVAPLAMAAGVSINWGPNCWGDIPQSVQTFACASNTSPANWRFTTSFKLDAGIPDYINWDTYVQAVSETGALPDFWKISIPTDCRGSIANVWVASQTYVGTGANCIDPFEGSGTFISGYGYLVPGVQIQIEHVNTLTAGMAIDANQEYFLSMLTIKNGKTVGTGACAGCATGMVFGFQEALIGLESGPVIRLSEPYDGGNQCIIWQHGWTGQPCNAPVESRNTTWGQVKSLYR